MSRPNRLYQTKGGKYYYIVDGKRMFVKVPKTMSQKQVQKVNVKTIINLPETQKRVKRRRKKVTPKYQSDIVGAMDKTKVGGLPVYFFQPGKKIPTIEDLINRNKVTDSDIIKSIGNLLVKDRERTVPAIENNVPAPVFRPIGNIAQPVPPVIVQQPKTKIQLALEDRERRKLGFVPFKTEYEKIKPTSYVDYLNKRKSTKKAISEEDYNSYLVKLATKTPAKPPIPRQRTPAKTPASPLAPSIASPEKKPSSKKPKTTDTFTNPMSPPSPRQKLEEYDDFVDFYNPGDTYEEFLDALLGTVDISKTNFDKFQKRFSKDMARGSEGEETERASSPGSSSSDDKPLRPTASAPVEGKGYVEEDGLYNTDISRVVKKRIRDFIPVIPADKTNELLKYVKQGDDRFGFIINTADSTSDGSGENGNSLGHWTACYVNNEDDYQSIEYFDPLCGEVPKAVEDIMKKIAFKMNPEKMFKYKFNMIQQQPDNSPDCGWFSIKFLEDRYNSVPFAEASGYESFIKEKHRCADNSEEGNDEIKKYIKKYKVYL